MKLKLTALSLLLLSSSNVVLAATTPAHKPVTQAPAKQVSDSETVPSQTSASQTAASAITAAQKPRPDWSYTAYGERMYDQSLVADNMYAIALYQPNFLLPFYYTETPDQQVYLGNTPNNQPIMRQELQGQISFEVPVVRNLWDNSSELDAAYTQLMMWQVYASSQYFRETDYAPEMFVTYHYDRNWTGRYSIIHQSNGRGGDMERSWNRVYADTTYSGNNWMVSVEPWTGVFESESTTLHNPDIFHYMGHGQVVAAYKTQNDLVFSAMSRNDLESRFQRGAEEVNMSFPINGHFRGYVKFFSGYGQTLIEYNHYTNAVGIGIVLNDLI